jgi:protein-tyrosine phosphatase
VRTVLFVCTANICRSPMALGVFTSIVQARGAASEFELDAAATHDYHVGKPPFPLAVQAAKIRGYDLTRLVSRRITGHDFDHYDHILAMDRGNIASLRTIAPTRTKHKIELLLEYGTKYHGEDVPDPYRGEARDFDLALDMIEDGCRGLAKLLIR